MMELDVTQISKSNAYDLRYDSPQTPKTQFINHGAFGRVYRKYDTRVKKYFAMKQCMLENDKITIRCTKNEICFLKKLSSNPHINTLYDAKIVVDVIPHDIYKDPNSIDELDQSVEKHLASMVSSLKQKDKKIEGYIHILYNIALVSRRIYKHVVRYYNCYVDTYLEYRETNLFDWIFRKHQHNPISFQDIQSIMKGILKGVQYCHDNDVIHRDIKPGNVLLNQNGSYVQLCDFGLATDSKMTSNLNVYTAIYRPPEIIYGNKSYTTKADLWAVGVIFLDMILRSMPFYVNQKEDWINPIHHQY